jgi:plasmid stabilization system protein ParE
MYDLPRFPGRGRLREVHGDGVRAYPVQQHVIYYRATDHGVTILRVLHARMDAGLLIEE